MTLPECKEVLLAVDDAVLTVTLNRPHKRNAMNAGLVAEIISVTRAARDDASIRAIVFRGAAGNFCAGGDIAGMNMDDMDEASATNATWEFNRVFGRMVTSVNELPQIVVAVLEGAVMGGGLGIACVSDVAIAEEDAMFSMPETGLGIIPAQIAPFVVARIGLTQARRLALLGDRIRGEEAVRLGIAHFLTRSQDELERKLADVTAQIRTRAPDATAATKRLLFDVGRVDLDELLDAAADTFTAALRGAEGQEGTAAFLEKRKPCWAESSE